MHSKELNQAKDTYHNNGVDDYRKDRDVISVQQRTSRRLFSETESKDESASVQAVTLGEAMIVMEPLSKGRLRHVSTFEKGVGGAELNVAVALSRLGHRSGWVGSLGSDEFGEEVLSFAKGEGVDVSRADLTPEAQTGIYFKERGVLGRLRAYYYRAGSAASGMRFDDLDLDYLLSSEVLHLTGITPLLSESCRDLIDNLMVEANERGVLVSFDANIRHRLFEGRDPVEALSPFVAHADLLFLSEEESKLLLNTSDPQAVLSAQREMRARTVIVHDSSGAFAAEGHAVIEKSAHPVESVDSVGAGDAFVAGFLSGQLRGWNTEECLGLANACGTCAVTLPGDTQSMPTGEEALSLLYGRSTVER